MDVSTLIDRLTRLVPGAAFEAGGATDQPTVYVPRERLVETCRRLRDDPALQFSLLAELTAVDWLPREPRFEVVYHLASLGVAIPGGEASASAVHVAPTRRLRLKVRVPGEDRLVPTVSGIWETANWLEREVYDLFGIVFEEHPDLRRILMPDDWEGHPLLKDYPVQINQRVQSSSPLQVTEEEFVANIAAARRATGRRGGSGEDPGR